MTKPRISVNKLGEYLTATPSRRKRIVEDQQEPKAFVVSRYGDAREAIVDYLLNRMSDDTEILARAHSLRQPTGGSEFTDQDRRASADAIHDFLDASAQISIDGLSVVINEANTSASLEISGVSVSMRPDALLKDPDNGQTVGFIKLHFPKSNPLNQQGGEYVATAVRSYIENSIIGVKIEPKRCYVVDVPTQSVFNAPKAYKRKLNDIAAACEEIYARWKK